MPITEWRGRPCDAGTWKELGQGAVGKSSDREIASGRCREPRRSSSLVAKTAQHALLATPRKRRDQVKKRADERLVTEPTA